MQTVYLLSGPAGVGKSTTSSALTKALQSSAYISGDDVSHMHVNGREKPWESETERSLIWNNILSLTKNFVTSEMDVVVDYVTFPREAAWIRDNLKELNVNVIYVVLWTDNETLMIRDQMRIPEYRMGERCLILMDEFKKSGLDDKHLLDTSKKSTEALDQIIEDIMSNKQYRLTDFK
jgi:gluconate kinase